ncbi:2-aminoethylphosphonate--pyruvate transaminase [Sansalvadorimonas sp. 2012CJ34-2]|uniref:2-aminoethylphosphonate--pyruvate transaminase n=1 Tax=Parendozoicomonas callyspongiae TaxID=2942213 RepID=A0ABT0PM12_9GAMM|nr:2-aminoethylphosphonate--pyruvate transaminase [Sansalvadorimonas sp. 2012CJ34-2]MCL6272021.1 2-aminoethylphosphonate--pyruvate transaminase [Sansalvadorimonas sp. 2012CJ34-2]
MSILDESENPYLLLTPGPLSTSRTVRQAMMRDWCTWDDDYNRDIVETIRSRLVELATSQPGYTAVLMQGSGTASVEATLGSIIPDSGCVLFITNGVYGQRMVEIARCLGIRHQVLDCGETGQPTAQQVRDILASEPAINHVAMVHCETTTGMLNPLAEVADVVKQSGCLFIVDAMSSFGGIPFDIAELGIDYLISSANKCIQGVPGFGFVIARQNHLEKCKGIARSLALDLYDQWQCMEKNHGKWRFTSPTHTVRAFYQALQELDAEGGVEHRYQRYCDNQKLLVKGMESLDFCCLLPHEQHSPFITSFYSPVSPDYSFAEFYQHLKKLGFVIYPGKVSDADCFRIGTIGEVYPRDIARLIEAVHNSMYWEHK